MHSLSLNQTLGHEGSKCAFYNLSYKQTVICTIKLLELAGFCAVFPLNTGQKEGSELTNEYLIKGIL